MGLAHSPKIVTDGLVFYTDMNNTEKSFRGPPNTNSVTNADTMAGWTNYYRTIASSTFVTEFGTTGYRFMNQPSWNGIYKSITIPAAGTYTFSARFRYFGGSANNNGATVYISGYGAGDTAVGLDKSKVGVWQNISITINCTNTTFTFYIISYGGTDNGTGNPDFSSWEVTMPQAEAGTFATPFVNGTRSNTQAIANLIRSNTVSATDLTYAANSTFSFNGSSNFIRWNNNTELDTQTPSVEVWVKTNATSQNGFWFEKGTVNSQYALFQEGDQIRWRMNIGGITQLSTTTASFMNTSSWAHVVATYTSGSRILYINGVQVSSDSQTGTIATNSGGMTIGEYGGAGYRYNGSIGAVRVYNKALTAAEVVQNFNALRGRYGV